MAGSEDTDLFGLIQTLVNNIRSKNGGGAFYFDAAYAVINAFYLMNDLFF